MSAPCPQLLIPPLRFPLSPTEGANFRSILDKAVQADQVVKDRYSTHCEMIALLCKPEQELSDAIPSANPMKTLQGSEVSRKNKTNEQTANRLAVTFLCRQPPRSH